MLKPREVRRYLSLIGVPERVPGADALAEIVRAHLMAVPFENISKLHRWKTSGFRGLVEIEQFLDGIEQYHFGGTCYSTNYHLNQLLVSLGYDAILCGADMSRPDVHLVNIVRLEGREYLVDAGYAAPFLEPLPRDLRTDVEVSLGNDRYVLSPQNATGHSRLTMFREGAARHGYRVNPRPREIGEFKNVIADSFRPDATFLNAVLLVRFTPDSSTVLHNMTRIESRGTLARTTSFTTVDELIGAIAQSFAIPEPVSRIALDGLSMRKDAWS